MSITTFCKKLVSKNKMKNRFLKFKKLIPAIITGGAGNDPSGIATYVLSGAVFGLTQVWLMVLALPMLVAVQSLCSRLGIVTKTGLSTLIKSNYGWSANILVSSALIIVNILTLSADAVTVAHLLSEIIGGSSFLWLLGLLSVVWYVSVFYSFKVLSRFLLVCVLAFLAYFPAAWLSGVNFSSLITSTIPNASWFTEHYVVSALALLGTTISPYMLFWQVVEENEGRHIASKIDSELKDEDKTVFPGFLFSQVVTILIMIVAAATLHKNGIVIKDILDAASSLEIVAGKYSQILFAVGVIGAGLLALPVLAGSASYVACESSGIKKYGLNKKPRVTI
jgi:Mn2+/Fe2+ NRAMP family transporter